MKQPAIVVITLILALFVIQIPANAASKLSDISGLADGTIISIDSPKVVSTPSGAFTDASMYIEEPDRSSGIRCKFNSGVAQPNLWDRVTFGGAMATDSAGERYVNVSTITTTSAGDAIRALGVGAKAINYGKPDMSGLLVRICGKVTYVDPGGAFFYVDDGSSLTDSSGVATGLRVIPVTTLPVVGDFITATGIAFRVSVTYGTSTVVVPVVQIANDPDLTVYMPPVRANDFTLGTCATLVNDSLASNGVAVMVPANCTGHAVQYPIPANVANASPVHIYIRIRCDSTTGSGAAFSYGLYDNSTSADLVSQTVQLQNGAGDGQYHLYDLGVRNLTTNMHIWVAAPGSTQATPAIYVDSVIFERVPLLTNNGRTGYSIVLGNNPTPTDSTAATELQQYLKNVTGVTLPIKAESQVSSNVQRILIGQSDTVKGLLPNFDWSTLGTDGIVVKNLGNTIILAGDEPNGVLYAVYDFLENQVGIRWWTSTESYIPSIPKLWIPEVDQVYTPQFSYRQPYYLDPETDDVFAARLKINTCYRGMDLHMPRMILFDDIIPPVTYFASHPEWFSMINGVRTCDNAQLCLSNTAMQQQAITNYLALIATDPDATMVPITQNDNTRYCQCPACTAVANEEGSQAGLLIRFVNAIADAVKTINPNAMVHTLAYQHTATPPKVTKPASNVLIQLCDFYSNVVQPLNSTVNASFQADLTGWEAITPNLWIWDYTANFANYIMPMPNLEVYGPNIKYFAEHNVTGVFEQGDKYSPCGDFCRLKCWVLAHLLWNPSLDETELVNEFLNGYYGPAGPYISSYLTTMHNAAIAAEHSIGCYVWDYDFLTLPVMNQATQYFNSAVAATGNRIIRSRIYRDRLPLDQAWVLAHPVLKQQQVIYGLPFYGPTDQLAAWNSFVSTCNLYKANYIKEEGPFADYVPEILPKCRPAATVPTECIGRTDWIDVPNNMFLLGSGGKAVIVSDSAASTGYAAKMVGDNGDWSVQYPVSDLIANAGNWHCYAVVKCALNGTQTSGDAFQMGIYDRSTGTGLYLTPTLQDGASDGLYHTYDLGTHQLSTNQLFWFGPINNPSVVSDVYVDRIFMIKAN